MSIKSINRKFNFGDSRLTMDNGFMPVNNNNNNITNNQDMDGDEDSMIELGQIAILSSSRASLRYRGSSALDMNASLNASINRRDESASRLMLNSNRSQIGNLDTIEQKKELLAGDDMIIQTQGPIDHISSVKATSFIEKLKQSVYIPFRGYIFGFLCTFAFCLSQVIIKRAKYLSGSDHSLIRYITTFIIMFVFLKYNQMSVMGPKKQLKLLIFRGFIGSCALISIYFAIMFINPSDIVALAHSSIIITAIMSRIFLKEKLTLAHLIALTLTIMGAILISKPTFIFSSETSIKSSNISTSAINCTLSNQPNQQDSVNCVSIKDDLPEKTDVKLVLGVSLTFVGAFSSSCVFLVLKKLCNSKVHWATSTIFVCWFGLPFSLIISTILYQFGYAHVDFEAERKFLPMDIFYSVMASILSVIGQIFLNISLKYEDATKIAIIKTVDVFISFTLQYILLNIHVDLLSIMGACSILTATFFVLIFKILDNRYELFKQNEMNKEQKDIAILSNEKLEQQLSEKAQEANKQSQNDQKKDIKTMILNLIFIKF